MSALDTKERLIQAYDRMMERVRHALDTAEHKTVPPLEHAIQIAREKAVELGEISREEAEKVGQYLQRDIHEFAEHLNDTGSELKSWFHMDMELIEAKVVDLISQVADQTRVELAQLAVSARSPRLYHCGEISAPGTLECRACGELIRFRKTGHIPPCPKCHGTEYVRLGTGRT
ncbi:MAG: zinc ribbon-containing protein [Pseudomonadota bacterium]